MESNSAFLYGLKCSSIVLVKRERVGVRIFTLFYTMLVQATLLYRSKTWVITSCMLFSLEGLHAGFAQGIIKMQLRWDGIGGW